MTVPVIMLLLYKKIKEQLYRIVLLTHHFLTLLIMLGWVFGVLNGAEWRLSPVVISSVIVCIVFVKWALSNIKMKRNVLIAGIPVVCLCIITFISMVTLDKHSYYNGEIRGLVKYLEESDLHYGYGTFWNANISTLLSDSKVKIRDITLDDDAYYKYRYNHPTLDIFVLDNRPKHFQWHSIWMRLVYLLAMGHRKHIQYEQHRGLNGVVTWIGSHIGKLFPMKTLAIWYDHLQESEKTKSGKYYLSNDMMTLKMWGLMYKAEMFEQERTAVLRGKELQIPYGTEDILTMQYGDYMQLPPVEQRKPQHLMEIVDAD